MVRSVHPRPRPPIDTTASLAALMAWAGQHCPVAEFVSILDGGPNDPPPKLVRKSITKTQGTWCAGPNGSISRGFGVSIQDAADGFAALSRAVLLGGGPR